MTIIFQLTTACNLRCSYCYQKNKCDEVMPFGVADAMLKDLTSFLSGGQSNIFSVYGCDSAQGKPITLDFFGGEATLCIDLIERICERFEELCDEFHLADAKAKYRIVVETNGVTFFSPRVHAFYERHFDRIDIPITIDGCKDCHDACRKTADGSGSYDLVEKAILGHKELLGCCPNSKLTISVDNMKYLKASIENYVRLGYKNLRSSFDVTTKMTKEQSEEYYSALKEAIDYLIDGKHELRWSVLRPLQGDRPQPSTCGIDGSQIAVDWLGDIYNCQQMGGSFMGDGKSFKLGNVREGITDFWLLNKLRHRSFLIMPRECHGCPIARFCEICPALNLKLRGDMAKCVFNCGASIAEARVQEYFAKRAKETDYPYMRDWVNEILSNEAGWYNPDYRYLLDAE